MKNHHRHSKIRSGKKVKVNGWPKEYRVFTLDADMTANVKVNSIKFCTLQPGLDAPVFMKMVITIPTESIVPYSSGPDPLKPNKRCFPIYEPAEDICPTDGVTIISSAADAVSTYTTLEVTMDSGGKVPGGVGEYFRERLKQAHLG